MQQPRIPFAVAGVGPRACAEMGRDPTSLGRLVLTGLPLDNGLSSVGAFTEVCERYAAAGVTDLAVHWPRSSEPFAGDPDTFERVVARRR